MTNLLALFLVFSSLFAAEVWSPSPSAAPVQQQQQVEDVIEKEGHRVIVVETYDQNGQHNTKVSISPERRHQDHHHDYDHRQETKTTQDQDDDHVVRATPRELICDAFGRCIHKIASVIGKAKDKTSEAAAREKDLASEAKEAVVDAYEKAKSGLSQKSQHVKGAAEDAYEKVKSGVSQKSHEVKEAAEVAYEKAKQKAAQESQHVKGAAEDAYETAKRTISHKSNQVKETAEDAYEKTKQQAVQKSKHVKGAAEDAYETAKSSIPHKSHEVKEAAEDAYEKAKQAAARKSQGAKEVVEDAYENVKETTKHNVLTRSVMYLAPPESWMGLTGVMNLLGFGIAYGMSVWITFVSSYVLSRALPRQQFGVVQSKIYPVYFTIMSYCIGLALFGHLVGRNKELFSRKPERFQAYNLVAACLAVIINLLYLEPVATKTMFERLKIEKEEGRGLENVTGETSRGYEQPQPQPAVGSDPATKSTAGDEVSASAPVSNKQVSEAEEGVRSRIAATNKKLRTLNSYSSFLNIFTLMSLTWHLVYLGQRLHAQTAR